MPTADLAQAAALMVEAITTMTATRRYLCPLDMADTLPPLRFGHARVERFDAAALRSLFDDTKLTRLHRGFELDADRLSEFHWLVVEETVAVAARIGERALPFLYADFGGDTGAIDPHDGEYAPVVNAALFALLLAPWEDWVRYDQMDWCGFRIPWIHLEPGDPFAKARSVPSADTLSWRPDAHHDEDGAVIEYERPLVMDLDAEAGPALATIDDAFWMRLETARKTSLFETPVEHFLVRGFFSKGMDEIIAHMTAIEAALGTRSDFGGRKPTPGYPRLKVKDRVARRIERLLGDAQAGTDYARLFETRSEFVHGRAIAAKVPSRDRIMARRLARRVTMALVDAANGPAGQMAREDYLTSLA